MPIRLLIERKENKDQMVLINGESLRFSRKQVEKLETHIRNNKLQGNIVV